VIATKVGFRTGEPISQAGLSRRHILASCERSLKRLNTDYIDLYIVHKDAGFKVVEKMREIAARHEASVAQIATAWLLAKPVVSSVIVGASKSHQLEVNLKAVDLKLNDPEVAELDAITAPTPLYPNWFNANSIDSQHKAATEAA